MRRTRSAAGSIAVNLFVLASALSPAAAQQPSVDGCFGTDATISLDVRIDVCTRVIETAVVSPDILAIAFQNRGTAFLQKGDNDRAIADLNEAVRIDPNYANAFNSRGVAYQAKGDNDRAIADYDQAIRLQPDNANALNGRCWLRAALGRLDTALADCNESLRLRPDNSNTLDSRGFVYLKLGRWDEAMVDCDAALRANPNNAWALYERGIAKLRKGDRVGGEADITASRMIDSTAEMELQGFGFGL